MFERRFWMALTAIAGLATAPAVCAQQPDPNPMNLPQAAPERPERPRARVELPNERPGERLEHRFPPEGRVPREPR